MSRVRFHQWEASLSVQVSLNLEALCTYIEHSFLLEGRQIPMVWLQSSLFEGL